MKHFDRHDQGKAIKDRKRKKITKLKKRLKPKKIIDFSIICNKMVENGKSFEQQKRVQITKKKVHEKFVLIFPLFIHYFDDFDEFFFVGSC